MPPRVLALIFRRPCVSLALYGTIALVVVVRLIAVDGPWVREGEIPEKSNDCTMSDSPFTPGDPGARAQYEAQRYRSFARLLADREESHDNPRSARRIESALRCADSLDAIAAWYELKFNWREFGWICFWFGVSLVPAWLIVEGGRGSARG